MSTSAPPPFPPVSPAPLPPGKKPNMLLWVLGGIAALMCLVMLMCGVGGYFLFKKAKDAGLDSALLSKNPAYAAAKMAVTMNPDVEAVSSDDDSGTIRIRDKRTGKVSTLKFDGEKKTMVVIDENGKEARVKLTGDGANAALEVQSADGTAKFGGGASNTMPAWMPVYPGSSPQGTFSTQNVQGSQLGFSFKTGDPASRVNSYFQDQLKAAGFNVTVATNTDQGGMVMAEDGAKTRSVMVTTSASRGETEATIVLTEKK